MNGHIVITRVFLTHIRRLHLKIYLHVKTIDLNSSSLCTIQEKVVKEKNMKYGDDKVFKIQSPKENTKQEKNKHGPLQNL